MRKGHGVLLEYLLVLFLGLFLFGYAGNILEETWKIMSKYFLPVSCYSSLPYEMFSIGHISGFFTGPLWRPLTAGLLNGRFVPAWHFSSLSAPPHGDLASGFPSPAIPLSHRYGTHLAMNREWCTLLLQSCPLCQSLPQLSSLYLSISFSSTSTWGYIAPDNEMPDSHYGWLLQSLEVFLLDPLTWGSQEALFCLLHEGERKVLALSF